nr:hypothetical protein [Marimonas lutisalis]
MANGRTQYVSKILDRRFRLIKWETRLGSKQDGFYRPGFCLGRNQLGWNRRLFFQEIHKCSFRMISGVHSESDAGTGTAAIKRHHEPRFGRTPPESSVRQAECTAPARYMSGPAFGHVHSRIPNQRTRREDPNMPGRIKPGEQVGRCLFVVMMRRILEQHRTALVCSGR